jgi:hypothetical protein
MCEKKSATCSKNQGATINSTWLHRELASCSQVQQISLIVHCNLITLTQWYLAFYSCWSNPNLLLQVSIWFSETPVIRISTIISSVELPSQNEIKYLCVLYVSGAQIVLAMLNFLEN